MLYCRPLALRLPVLFAEQRRKRVLIEGNHLATTIVGGR